MLQVNIYYFSAEAYWGLLNNNFKNYLIFDFQELFNIYWN